jgi:hypothetical protein
VAAEAEVAHQRAGAVVDVQDHVRCRGVEVDDAAHRRARRQGRDAAGHQHLAADQIAGLDRLARGEVGREALEGLVELVDAGHRAELGDLAQELAVLHRLHRILVLELRDHQLEEVVQAEVATLGLALGLLACEAERIEGVGGGRGGREAHRNLLSGRG